MINIYVGNLPYSTEENELVELFGQFGEVVKVTLMNDRQTGRPRGFGFVEMADHAQGAQAIEELAGQLFNGRHLTVNEARNRLQENPPTSGHPRRASRTQDADSPTRTGQAESFGQIGGGYSNSLVNRKTSQ